MKNELAETNFSKSIGMHDAKFANLVQYMKLLQSLNNLNGRSLYSLIIESDSINAVKWVSEPTIRFGNIENEYLELSLSKRKIEDWKIIHTLRNANGVADQLVKNGVLRENDLLNICP